MNYEVELRAMRQIIKSLESLDNDARLRVMKYIIELEDSSINTSDKELEGDQ